MTTWTPDELDRIGAADELEITTARGDGSLRRWTPIWVVRVGDDLYVRSYRGADGAWYRHATRHAQGRIRAGGVERDVTVNRPEDTVRPAIDDAYRAKYARYGAAYLQPMLAARATATTLRLTPAPDPRERTPAMAQDEEPSGAQKAFGDFAPALVGFTDDVLFGQVWPRRQLSAKERSLITVAALTTGGNTDQLVYHLGLAKQNGATEDELKEAITHLAFYAGWPKAMSAMTVAKQVFSGDHTP